jgi:hypothetical protein
MQVDERRKMVECSQIYLKMRCLHYSHSQLCFLAGFCLDESESQLCRAGIEFDSSERFARLPNFILLDVVVKRF